MKFYYLFLCSFLWGSKSSFAQSVSHCSESKQASHQRIQKKTRANAYANALMSKYDVHFYFLDFKAERNNTLVDGATTMGVTVTAPQLDTFCFELNQNLDIDSVVSNGQQLQVSRSGDITYAIFTTAQPMNANIYVKIYYNGDANVTGGAAIGNGYSSDVSGLWGNSATWSLSEPYSAYEWFPCKQFLQDKADSAWVFVTTSNQNKAGSNGLLEGVDTLPNNKVRYRWKTRYTIDYYLISVAIAKYVEYTIYSHPAAIAPDSVMIMNYVYDNPQTLPYFKDQIDSNALVMEYFSDLMGIYPFHAEKYGHCMAPFSGGMEHQTMTSIGNLGSFSVNSHELFHQWWGDHVTCKTWKDIFINEGFASYGEYLAYDHFRGWPAAQQKMFDVHDNVLQDSFAMVYFTDTTNVGRIFSKRLTYDKGSAVIHTLRFIMGDSLFFKGLRDFQSIFSFSNASIDDLHISLETTSGLALNDYFNQWIYGEGYPVYSVEYFSNGSNIFLKVSHNTSSANTNVFTNPLELKCLGLNGDTTVILDINQNVNTFVIPSSKLLTGIVIDPNNWILNKEGSIVQNPALLALSNEDAELQHALRIYPNPVMEQLSLDAGSNTAVRYTLRDLSGRVWAQGNFDHTTSIPMSGLPAGSYMLAVQTGSSILYRKVQKK